MLITISLESIADLITIRLKSIADLITEKTIAILLRNIDFRWLNDLLIGGYVGREHILVV